MEREIPDVFNIFALGNPVLMDKRRGGVPLPGISSGRDELEYSWTPRLNEQLSKWQDRSSPCERPRTYDKFYQKLPGNFLDPQTDSAISVCSSEENDHHHPPTSPTTTNNSNNNNNNNSCDKKKRKTRKSERQSRKDLHYSRTLTEHDVRHLERHLSMKRTIRKKIMRDLQQAFVQDPREFTKVTRKRDINLKSLNFDRKTGTGTNGQSEPNFLDMLRDSDDSGNGSLPRNQDQHKFRSCRERRRRSNYPEDPRTHDWTREADRMAADVAKLNLDQITVAAEPPPDYHMEDIVPAVEKEKKSFWQKLTGGRKKEKKEKT